MTPAEEEAQRAANAAGLETFMAQLSDATAKPARETPSDDDAPARPQSEAEAEKMQAESDRLVDRVMARMDREGDKADFEKIMSEEIERARKERGEPDPTPEQEAARAEWIDDMNAAAAEALEMEKSEDWKRGADGASSESHDLLDEKHPVAARAFEFSLRVVRETRAHGWIEDEASSEHPVTVLIAGVTSAGAKLAGALDGDDWPPELDFCAGVIVRLKKAAGYLEDAKLAVDSCREEKLVDPVWLEEIATEIAVLAAETDALIAELRARLKDGA
jgi:hypothetical protein